MYEVDQYTCDLCSTVFPFINEKEQSGKISECEICGRHFCNTCFEGRHGRNALTAMWRTSDKLICPDCFRQARSSVIFDEDTFLYETAKPGDLVDSKVVMNAMNAISPATMRLSCAQMGEPYSHEEDPKTGRLRSTHATFKCKEGGWDNGVWEYCGNCFCGETVERGVPQTKIKKKE